MTKDCYVKVPNKIARNVESCLGAPAQRLYKMLNYCIDLYPNHGETWTVPIPLILEVITRCRKWGSGDIAEMKRVHDELKRTVQHYENEEKHATFSPVDLVVINKDENTVTYTVNHIAKFGMLKVADFYTKSSLLATLGCRSGYTLRLYDFLKSYESQGKISVTVERLRELTQTKDKYPTWRGFKARIIQSSVDELNTHSDIEVSYTPIPKTNGRGIVSIQFDVKAAPPKFKQVHEDYSALLKKIRLNGECRSGDGTRQILAERSTHPNVKLPEPKRLAKEIR